MVVRSRVPGVLALLVSLSCLLLFSDPGAGVLATNDETRSPVLARDILAHGHGLLARLNGAPHLNKPPLRAWLIAFAAWPLGSLTQASAAVPSLLAALGVVVADVAREPLRVLQLYPKSDYFTGAAVQLRELAGGLKRRGHEVVLVARPSDVWAEKARDAGIPYYPLSMTSELDLRSVLGLVRILRAHRIQIVHAHKGRARTLAMLAGLFVRIPVLVLNRGVSFPLDPFNRLGYTTRRVTAIVAVCESIKRGLVAAGIDSDKIHVIYSGTDTDRFHPLVDGSSIRRELGLTPDHFVITQVGVRSWKGNDDVIDAMAMVARRAPLARLLIVGARRPEGLLERARRRGLADNVFLWGYREDIPEILAATDCCVDASYAGLGLTGALREALAVETAATGTAIGGNPELVIDGETGLLVPPRDPPALAAAMVRMIEDPALRRRTAVAGRKLVEARFSLRAKLDATEALYRRLVAERCRQ